MKNATHHRWLRSITGIFFILFLQISAFAQSSKIIGHWEGSIDIMGDELEVVIDFERPAASIQGEISIPAQGISELALKEIRLTADSAKFMISEVGGAPTFQGFYKNDGTELSGDFIQYGQKFPFSLKKEAKPSAKALASLEGLDSVISHSIDSYRIPGLAVAIVADDEVVYNKGFGYRHRTDSLPVTPHTLFAIGSSTKAFTTFALSTLVDEGEIEWDRPVKDYIPWFRMSEDYLTDHLTVRDLVTHRSGLPRHDILWYNNEEYSRKELVESLEHLETTAGLRERFQYNNLMYLTAGYLTEHITGTSWENNVRQRILKPLDMKRTNFSVRASMEAENHALPYMEEQDTLIAMPFRDISTVGAAGSINSSAEEMSRWIRMQLAAGEWEDEELLSTSLVKEMHQPRMTIEGGSSRSDISASSYGLGWFIDTWRGHKRVHHGGNIDGFSALVTLFPNDDIGMVILTNKDGAALPSALSQHIADRLLELEAEPWIQKELSSKNQAYAAMEQAGQRKEADRKEGTSHSHELFDYAGTYEHPGYGTVRFEHRGDSLYMKYHDITTSLTHWHYDVFNGAHSPDPVFEDMKMQFSSNLDGYISKVELPFEQSTDPIVFEKQPAEKWFDPAFIDRFTGKYTFMGSTVTIRRVGNELRADIPGQAERSLVPVIGDQFSLEEYPAIQFIFEPKEEGGYTLIIDQPQGRFEAEPVEEE